MEDSYEAWEVVTKAADSLVDSSFTSTRHTVMDRRKGTPAVLQVNEHEANSLSHAFSQDSSYKKAREVVDQQEMTQLLVDYCTARVEEKLDSELLAAMQVQLVVTIWDEYMSLKHNQKLESGQRKFSDLVEQFAGYYKNLEHAFVDLRLQSAKLRMQAVVQTTLYHWLPPCFDKLASGYYESILRDCHTTHFSGKDSSDLEQERTNFESMCKKMMDIGLLQYTMDVFNKAMLDQVSAIIADGAMNLTIEEAMDKMEAFLFPWLRIFWAVLNNGECTRWERRLQDHAYLQYGRKIMDQLLEIVLTYPDDDSGSRLRGLQVCMSKVPLKREILLEFRKTLENRLLTPHAATQTILNVYVQSIRCFNVLDPSGGFAVELLNPVRNYLRERKDAIRSILSLLTDDSSLLEEDQAENLDEDGDLDDMDWLPEPIDSFGTRKERLAAIVSRLLDIHDTREAYVNEFQELLAKKLLEFDDDDEDQHIANVELLAAKLGQHGMDQCRVMISDLHESQRHDDDMATGNGLLRAVVLSTACWPDFEDVHDMTMPQSIHEDMGDYEYAYREKQKARHLVWMPNYGRVVLNLEFNGEFREFRCSPGEATVIELFGEDEEGKAHDTWTLDGLANELEMSAERVHPYIQFWVKHGAVTEGPPGTYKVNDNLRDVGNASMEIDPEPPEGKHSAEEEDGLDLTPNLIKNRLGFEKSQTAEQILEYYSGMAKMGLAIRDLTVEDVENLMNNMLNEGVLSLAKGVYSLKRA